VHGVPREPGSDSEPVAALEPMSPDEAQHWHDAQRAFGTEQGEKHGVEAIHPHYGGCWCCCDDCGDEMIHERVLAWEDMP
jgi:hypothetical protein